MIAERLIFAKREGVLFGKVLKLLMNSQLSRNLSNDSCIVHRVAAVVTIKRKRTALNLISWRSVCGRFAPYKDDDAVRSSIGASCRLRNADRARKQFDKKHCAREGNRRSGNIVDFLKIGKDGHEDRAESTNHSILMNASLQFLPTVASITEFYISQSFQILLMCVRFSEPLNYFENCAAITRI